MNEPTICSTLPPHRDLQTLSSPRCGFAAGGGCVLASVASQACNEKLSKGIIFRGSGVYGVGFRGMYLYKQLKDPVYVPCIEAGDGNKCYALSP